MTLPEDTAPSAPAHEEIYEENPMEHNATIHIVTENNPVGWLLKHSDDAQIQDKPDDLKLPENSVLIPDKITNNDDTNNIIIDLEPLEDPPLHSYITMCYSSIIGFITRSTQFLRSNITLDFIGSNTFFMVLSLTGMSFVLYTFFYCCQIYIELSNNTQKKVSVCKTCVLLIINIIFTSLYVWNSHISRDKTHKKKILRMYMLAFVFIIGPLISFQDNIVFLQNE